MSGKTLPPSSRSIRHLFASGVLIAVAGLAGMAATAIPASPATADGAAPVWHPARIRDKFGYADSAGRMVIPARFDLALPFHDGVAAVREKNRWFFLDRAGRPVAVPADTAPLASCDGIPR